MKKLLLILTIFITGHAFCAEKNPNIINLTPEVAAALGQQQQVNFFDLLRTEKFYTNDSKEIREQKLKSARDNIKQLFLIYHPDRNPAPIASDVMKILNAINEKLNNPATIQVEVKQVIPAQNEPRGKVQAGVKRKPEEIVVKKEEKKQKMDLSELHNLFAQTREDAGYHESLRPKELIDQKIKTIIETMKASNVDVNVVFDVKEDLFNNGMTPLTYSSSSPRLNTLSEWLIINGADVNKESAGKYPFLHTPLQNAINGYNLHLIKLLIFHGADVNYYPEKGSLFLPIHQLILRFSDARIFGQERVDKWKAAAKELLINGADFKNAQIQTYLNRRPYDQFDYAPIARRALDEVIQEIITEYRTKLNNYIIQLKQLLVQQGYLLPELDSIIAIYANYSDEQIMDNIMEIRYMLGELSPKQKEIYEEKQKIQQQDQPMAAAAARPIAPAQQAAAAMQD